MNYPNVSIITYLKDKNFIDLFILNLNNTNYDKNKLELNLHNLTEENIEEKIRNDIYPIKLNYIDKKSMNTIGEIKNKLVKNATYKTCICMGHDCIYMPEYITHTIETLINNNVDFVGSDEMYILYPQKNYKLSYIKSENKYINENTICFTKKYHKIMGGFSKLNINETEKLYINNDNIKYTNIKNCLINISHKKELINKDKYYNYGIESEIINSEYLNIIEDITHYKIDIELYNKENEKLKKYNEYKNKINNVVNNMGIIKSDTHLDNFKDIFESNQKILDEFYTDEDNIKYNISSTLFNKPKEKEENKNNTIKKNKNKKQANKRIVNKH